MGDSGAAVQGYRQWPLREFSVIRNTTVIWTPEAHNTVVMGTYRRAFPWLPVAAWIGLAAASAQTPEPPLGIFEG